MSGNFYSNSIFSASMVLRRFFFEKEKKNI
jgi:hypothetical protein